jgi:hypothetical protein
VARQAAAVPYQQQLLQQLQASAMAAAAVASRLPHRCHQQQQPLPALLLQ